MSKKDIPITGKRFDLCFELVESTVTGQLGGTLTTNPHGTHIIKQIIVRIHGQEEGQEAKLLREFKAHTSLSAVQTVCQLADQILRESEWIKNV